jgi:hypothetical protein
VAKNPATENVFEQLTEKELKDVKSSLLNRLHLQGKLSAKQIQEIETANPGWVWATKREFTLWEQAVAHAKKAAK